MPVRILKYCLLLLPFFGFGEVCVAQESRSLIREGNRAYEKSDYAKAQKKYLEASRKEGEDFASNFNLGDALFQRKQYQAAEEAYKRSLPKAPGKADKSKAFYNLGNALLKQDKLEESIDAYKNSLRANPDDASAKYNLTYALEKLKKKKQQQQNQIGNGPPKPDQNGKDKNKPENKPGQGPIPHQNDGNPEGGITEDEARKLLNALKNDEMETRKHMIQRSPEDRTDRQRNEKPW
jgi:tetratricopeptide (TPR) repeat protein